MKKALKILAITLGSLFIVAVVAFLLFVRALPSTWELKQAVTPKKAIAPEFVAKATPTSLPEKSGAKTEAPKTHDDKVDDSKELSQTVLRNDFLNDKKPLSGVCNSLSAASQSHFLRRDESASANEFMKKLNDENNKDPLVESAAPLFRYVFRLASVKELVEMIDKAQATDDHKLTDKAWFYAKLGLAAQEVRANKANIDNVLMKSYNMYMLTKVVAQKPELARDPATLSFCDQIEKNINFNMDFNADEQATELQKFLDYAKVTPKEIEYDPAYRSNVSFNFQDGNLLLNKVWIEKLFAEDLKKAKKEVEPVLKE